jgi:hypothetical protein
VDSRSPSILRISISSPGDVEAERDRAAEVLRRLRKEVPHYATLGDKDRAPILRASDDGERRTVLGSVRRLASPAVRPWQERGPSTATHGRVETGGVTTGVGMGLVARQMDPVEEGFLSQGARFLSPDSGRALPPRPTLSRKVTRTNRRPDDVIDEC